MASLFGLWSASEKPKSLKRPPAEEDWQSEYEEENKAKKAKPNNAPTPTIEVIVTHRQERRVRNTGRSRLDRSQIGLVKNSSDRSRPESDSPRKSDSQGPVTPQNHLRIKQIIQGHNCPGGQCHCGCQCRCQRQNVCQCGCQYQCQRRNACQCGCDTAKACCRSGSPPTKDNGHQQAEPPVKPGPEAASHAQTPDAMQQVVAAKDQTIAFLKGQNEHQNDKIRTVEKQRDKACKDLTDVYARAAACHRPKLPCQNSDPVNGCGEPSSGKFNLKEHEEVLLRKLQEWGVPTNVSTNQQGSVTRDHLGEKVDEVQASVQSIGTRQDEFEARMEARFTAMEQTTSDNLLGVQSNLGEQIEEQIGLVVTQVRHGVNRQLDGMESNLSQQMGQHFEAFARNLVVRPTIDETVVSRLFVPFAQQMENRIEAFMRELSSRPIVTAAPDTALQTEIAELRANNTSQEQQILTLTSKVNQSEASIQTLTAAYQKDLAEKDNGIEALQGTLDEVLERQGDNSGYKSAEAEAILEENVQLKAKIAKLEGDAISHQSDMTSKERALQAYEEGRKTDKETLESQSTEAERREEEQAKLQGDLGKTIKGQEDTIINLNDKAREMADKSAKLEADVETLKSDNAEKDKIIQDLMAKNDKLRDEALAASKTRDEIKGATGNLLEQLTALNKKVEDLQANNKKTTQANIDLNAENEKLRAERKEQASTEQIVTLTERENVAQPNSDTDAPLLLGGPQTVPQPAPAIAVKLPASNLSPQPHTEGGPQVTPQPIPESTVASPAPNINPLLNPEGPATTLQPDPATAVTSANAEEESKPSPAKGGPRNIKTLRSRIGIHSKIQGESADKSQSDSGKKILPKNFSFLGGSAADVSGMKEEASVDTAPPESPVPAPQPPTQPALEDGRIFDPKSLAMLTPWGDVQGTPKSVPQLFIPSAGFQIPQDPLKFTTSFGGTSAQADNKRPAPPTPTQHAAQSRFTLGGVEGPGSSSESRPASVTAASPKQLPVTASSHQGNVPPPVPNEFSQESPYDVPSSPVGPSKKEEGQKVDEKKTIKKSGAERKKAAEPTASGKATEPDKVVSDSAKSTPKKPQQGGEGKDDKAHIVASSNPETPGKSPDWGSGQPTSQTQNNKKPGKTEGGKGETEEAGIPNKTQTPPKTPDPEPAQSTPLSKKQRKKLERQAREDAKAKDSPSLGTISSISQTETLEKQEEVDGAKEETRKDEACDSADPSEEGGPKKEGKNRRGRRGGEKDRKRKEKAERNAEKGSTSPTETESEESKDLGEIDEAMGSNDTVRAADINDTEQLANIETQQGFCPTSPSTPAQQQPAARPSTPVQQSQPDTPPAPPSGTAPTAPEPSPPASDDKPPGVSSDPPPTSQYEDSFLGGGPGQDGPGPYGGKDEAPSVTDHPPAFSHTATSSDAAPATQDASPPEHRHQEPEIGSEQKVTSDATKDEDVDSLFDGSLPEDDLEPIEGIDETPLTEGQPPSFATLTPGDIADHSGEIESGVVPVAEEGPSKNTSVGKQVIDEAKEAPASTGPKPLERNDETPFSESQQQPPPTTLTPSDATHRCGDVESGVPPEAEEGSSKEVPAEKAGKQAVDESKEEPSSTGLRASSCPSRRWHANSDADFANRDGEEQSATPTPADVTNRDGEVESGVPPIDEEGSSKNVSAEKQVADEGKKGPSSTGLTVHEEEEPYASGPQASPYTSRGTAEDDAIFLDDDKTQTNVEFKTKEASTEKTSTERQNVNIEEEEPYTSGPLESSEPSKPRNCMDEDAEFLDLVDTVEAPTPAPKSGNTACSMDSMFSALQDIENEPRPGLMEPLQPQRAQPLQQAPSDSITNDPIDYSATRSNETGDQHMDDAAVPSPESQQATQDAQLHPASATNSQRVYSEMELSHLFKNTNLQSGQHTAMELDDTDQRMEDAPEPPATHQEPLFVLPHTEHMNEDQTVPSFSIPQAENTNGDRQMEDVMEPENEQQPPTTRHPEPERPVGTMAADRNVLERRDQVLHEQNANRIMRIMGQTSFANPQSLQHGIPPSTQFGGFGGFGGFGPAIQPMNNPPAVPQAASQAPPAQPLYHVPINPFAFGNDMGQLSGFVSSLPNQAPALHFKGQIFDTTRNTQPTREVPKWDGNEVPAFDEAKMKRDHLEGPLCTATSTMDQLLSEGLSKDQPDSQYGPPSGGQQTQHDFCNADGEPIDEGTQIPPPYQPPQPSHPVDVDNHASPASAPRQPAPGSLRTAFEFSDEEEEPKPTPPPGRRKIRPARGARRAATNQPFAEIHSPQPQTRTQGQNQPVQPGPGSGQGPQQREAPPQLPSQIDWENIDPALRPYIGPPPARPTQLPGLLTPVPPAQQNPSDVPPLQADVKGSSQAGQDDFYTDDNFDYGDPNDFALVPQTPSTFPASSNPPPTPSVADGGAPNMNSGPLKRQADDDNDDGNVEWENVYTYGAPGEWTAEDEARELREYEEEMRRQKKVEEEERGVFQEQPKPRPDPGQSEEYQSPNPMTGKRQRGDLDHPYRVEDERDNQDTQGQESVSPSTPDQAYSDWGSQAGGDDDLEMVYPDGDGPRRNPAFQYRNVHPPNAYDRPPPPGFTFSSSTNNNNTGTNRISGNTPRMQNTRDDDDDVLGDLLSDDHAKDPDLQRAIVDGEAQMAAARLNPQDTDMGNCGDQNEDEEEKFEYQDMFPLSGDPVTDANTRREFEEMRALHDEPGFCDLQGCGFCGGWWGRGFRYPVEEEDEEL